MAKQAAVTFFYQSSFTVAINKTLLVFSYWETDNPALPEVCRLSEKDLQGFNNIVVFIPRNAKEHNDPAVFAFKKSFPISYVVADDARDSVPKGDNIRIVGEGDMISVANVTVGAHGSTDAGVSFMVRADGVRVFHAGDLNLWHWREENTLREITRAEEVFYSTVDRLPKDPIDICMFPVDPNLGGFYAAGANHFIMKVKPTFFFPMHWASRPEIAMDYARRMHTLRTTVHALTQPRETALIDLDSHPPSLRTSAADKRLSYRQRPKRPAPVVLNAYIHGDPFSETDLPVDLPADSIE